MKQRRLTVEAQVEPPTPRPTINVDLDEWGYRLRMVKGFALGRVERTVASAVTLYRNRPQIKVVRGEK